ncbi:ATP-dependent sacrificial sulfur transferase LarE [Clostridium aciditolerans]|uniref:ATP-dependent sacrificial sulfur transferase LarE n=1 Tax=Clostridium aciditolerans TaxID=339861 RepID=A0A934M6N0_9CLOT|nr:ATP-dependent sacrificial sulfur transferase LarE [Clostridium aciditolerans]MBI6873181.1 ATP-dependent sacrificial sulfur transferase LarE [Clostridium aciditolerans]
MIENKKYRDLISSLKKLNKVVIAFSGGVDSTFLVKAAKEALGDNVIAVTVVSPYIPKWEIEEAKSITKNIGIRHELLEVPVIIDEIKFNPLDRCYLCKKAVFTKIKELAKKCGFEYVVDGTNADDTKDYRPGLRALSELDVKSPLLENGITKSEIREFSKKLNLPTWDKPSYACLLSRIPYDEEIKVKDLDKIEKSEKHLMDLGFRAIRVRCHGDLARIEVPKEQISKITEGDLAEKISKSLKEFGFKYVTLDMDGYRTGSLNEGLV